MQSVDLEELLEQSRRSNSRTGTTGALVYAEGIFLQVLEGDPVVVKALMEKISLDVRHESVTVLRESEIPQPLFASWKMAYLSATREQVAKWAGLTVAPSAGESQTGVDRESYRTAQFAQDILALLAPEMSSPGSVD